MPIKGLTQITGTNDGGDEAQVGVDNFNKALYSICSPHAKLHEGYSFAASYSTTTASTDDHRTMISFTTPAEGVAELHMVITATASNAAEVFVSEAVTIDSDPGANVAPMNRNRNSVLTSKIGSQETTPTLNEYTTLNEAQVAAATFSAGTQLAYEVLKAGGGPKPIGGATRGTQEFVLKYATKYAAWIQNIGASANTQVLNIDWYEVY